MELGKKIKGMGLATAMLASSVVGLGAAPVDASKSCGGSFHSHTSSQHSPGIYYMFGGQGYQTWSARHVYITRYGTTAYGGWVSYGSAAC